MIYAWNFSKKRQYNIMRSRICQGSAASETFVTDIFVSDMIGQPAIVISAPIIIEDNSVGVIAAAKDIENLNGFFTSSFNGSGFAFVCDSGDNIIAKTDNYYTSLKGHNLLDFLKDVEFVDGDAIDTLDEVLM